MSTQYLVKSLEFTQAVVVIYYFKSGTVSKSDLLELSESVKSKNLQAEESNKKLILVTASSPDFDLAVSIHDLIGMINVSRIIFENEVYIIGENSPESSRSVLKTISLIFPNKCHYFEEIEEAVAAILAETNDQNISVQELTAELRAFFK